MPKDIRVSVSEELHTQVKIEAAREGTTMTKIVVALLRAWLREKGIEVE